VQADATQQTGADDQGEVRAAGSRCGHGRVAFAVSGGRTVVTRALARSPLRLLTPRRPHPAAWVYASSFGGGLVDGDSVELDVAVGGGAIALITTQASTKVYRSPSGCRQATRAAVAAGAALALVPDPIVGFAGARYEQTIDVRLEEGASLVLVDGFTAGRSAHGERWQASRYASRVRIERPEGPLLRDALVLDPAHGDVAARMGRFEAMATMILLGPRLADAARAALDEVAATPATPGPLLEAASPLGDGALLRVAADDTEAVTAWLRRRFSPVAAVFGGDPSIHKG
jgi:urease accessory protein